jgi:hypothetical protein
LKPIKDPVLKQDVLELADCQALCDKEKWTPKNSKPCMAFHYIPNNCTLHYGFVEDTTVTYLVPHKYRGDRKNV